MLDHAGVPAFSSNQHDIWYVSEFGNIPDGTYKSLWLTDLFSLITTSSYKEKPNLKFFWKLVLLLQLALLMKFF